jgi:hypothetical protein
MKTTLVILLISMVFSSCNSHEVETILLKEGTYTGTFYRSSPNAKYQASDVTIEFSENKFEGQGSIPKYPAICRGIYKIKGEQIEFRNYCPWTAEFDWSYILTGEFDISKNGDKIIIRKNYGGGKYDTYILTKQYSSI